MLFETNKRENGLLINRVSAMVTQAKKDIDKQAKYYNLQWKKEMLQQLKGEAIQLYTQAISEANVINKQFEDRIKEVENQEFPRARVTQDELVNLQYDLQALKAELNMADSKNNVIDKWLATKTGAKVVMMMFSEPNLDLGLWTKDIYARAFVASKSQAELDFEVKKQKEIDAIKTEQASAINIGSLYAAQRVLTGNPSKGLPALARTFDDEILACERSINDEREKLKLEICRELAREEIVNLEGSEAIGEN